MEIALEVGADDITTSELAHEILCSPEAFENVRQAIKDAEIEIQSDDLSMVADNLITLDLATARKVQRLIEALEDHDDVDAVYSNSDVPDDVIAELVKD